MHGVLSPEIYSAPNGGVSVRIANDFRKSVIFVGEQQGGSFVPKGTAFLLAGKKYGGQCNYILTAYHVAKAVDDLGYSLRLNMRPSGSNMIEAPKFDWSFDKDADLAVAIYDAPSGSDIFYLPDSMLFRDDKIKSKRVEGGTPAYVAGLFNRFAGTDRNLPVVHTGHIALLPEDEEIPLKDERSGLDAKCRCFLVQIQTLPGCSGSPVFIRRPVKTFPLPKPYEDTGMFPESYGAPFLLG